MTPSAYMSKMLKNVPEFLAQTVDFQKFRYIFDIFDICQKFRYNFLDLFLVRIFGKIFGKFRKIFGLVSDFEIPGNPKYWETQNTGKVERPKIFGKGMALLHTLF